MTIHRVLMERREALVVWVEADTEDEAKEAAMELSDVSDDWYDLDATEVEDIAVVNLPPVGERYWTGGPDGRWVTT